MLESPRSRVGFRISVVYTFYWASAKPLFIGLPGYNSEYKDTILYLHNRVYICDIISIFI